MIALILIIFLPNFYIELSQLSFDYTTLPKVNELKIEDFLSDNSRLNFSLFDEMYAAVFPVKEGLDESIAATLNMSYFSLLGAAFFIIGFFVAIIMLFKYLSYLKAPENFALEAINKVTNESRRRRKVRTGPVSWTIIGVFMDIWLIVTMVNMMKMVYSDRGILSSYFVVFSGITVYGYITILAFAAMVAASIYGVILFKKNQNGHPPRDLFGQRVRLLC